MTHLCELCKQAPLVLPPKSQWVNIHNNCFHLHEIEGE